MTNSDQPTPPTQGSSSKPRPESDLPALPLLTFDESGVVQQWNALAGEAFGLTDRMVSVPITTLVAPDQLTRVLDHLRRCRSGHAAQVTTELEFRRSSGTPFFVELVSVRLHDGERVTFRSVLVDLTERKRAEAMLIEQKRYVDVILETLPQALVVVDSRMTIRSVNNAFCKLFQTTTPACQGWRFEDWEGARWSEIDLTAMVRKALNRRSAVDAIEAEAVLRPTGQRLTLLVHGRSLRLPGHDGFGLLLAFDDVTGRKRIETERQRLFALLDQSRRELEERVAQRTAELRDAKTRLEELSKALMEIQETERRRISLELHDEIGQQLTALKLLLGAMDVPEAGDLAERIKEARDVVSDALDHVRDLSTLLRPRLLDELGLLAALQSHFARYRARTGIRVHSRFTTIKESHLHPSLKTTLFRVVQEGLTNVARHAETASVSVVLVRKNGALHLTIRDRGKGFTRLPVGLSDGISGMEERVRLAGGTFSIDAAPGKGTTIRAVFPLPVDEGS